MHPSAVRKREYRKRQRSSSTNGSPAGAVGSPGEARASIITTAAPAPGLHETVPVKGPGADAFASLPFLPSSKEGELGAPIVAEAAPAPTQITEAEAQAVGVFVVGLFSFGLRELFEKRPSFARKAGQVVNFKTTLPQAFAMVHGSAVRCAVKYNIQMAYADEGVVAGAIAVAMMGIVCKPESGAHTAKNANVPAAAPSEAGHVPAEETGGAEDMSDDMLNGIGS